MLVTTRTTPDADWSAPVNLGATVNSAAWDAGPRISADGLALFFFSRRPGGFGNYDLWVTTRKTTNDNWGIPVNLGPTVNGSFGEVMGSITADGLLLFYDSNADWPGRVGIIDMWQAPILPIVDLNADGIVDAADMCIMVDYWGTDNKLCDIGPMPWGDGVVDVEDMKVLAKHLSSYPGAVAYWTLDETEGDVAYDDVSDCDGIVIGGPVWQPDGGMVGGALRFDGVDDYITTDYVLNPADGAFSFFAWIKGGAPNQVVISQTDHENWLLADSSGGNLMTELKGTTRGATALLSETSITDSNWHRIGFVWDGSFRRLYVDGIIVAEDVQDNLDVSSNGLYIGTGKAMQPGTFFSGLIDDIRIYNRVVSP